MIDSSAGKTGCDRDNDGGSDWTKAVAWNDDGLVPAIAQDANSGDILMMAWMNPESLRLTVLEQRAIYYSRSRQKLWRKGESSGHVQHLREIRLDCDGDTVLLKVIQEGDVACHTGRRSCFYRKLEDHRWRTTDPVLKGPDTVYGHNPDSHNLDGDNH